MTTVNVAILALLITPLLALPQCPIELQTGEGDGGEHDGICLSEPVHRIPAAAPPDGVADMELVIETVASTPPIELVAGAVIQIQGSYLRALGCGDDDVSCPDSFVARDANGRFIVGMFQSTGPSPVPDAAFFDELGVDAATWMAPLEFTVIDDRPCPITVGPCEGNNIRMRLEVGAGACEPARLIDESSGHLARQFFVSINDLERWDPPFACVDEIDSARVFVSRQPCLGAKDCPTHASDKCLPDDARAQDRAYVRFTGEHVPARVAYDEQCAIMSVEYDIAGTYRYALDCGDLG